MRLHLSSALQLALQAHSWSLGLGSDAHQRAQVGLISYRATESIVPAGSVVECSTHLVSGSKRNAYLVPAGLPASFAALSRIKISLGAYLECITVVA